MVLPIILVSSVTSLKRLPRSVTSLKRLPRSVTNLKRLPRSVTNLKRLPRSVANLKRLPRSVANLKCLPRSVANLKCMAIHKWSIVTLQPEVERARHRTTATLLQPHPLRRREIKTRALAW